MTCTVDLVSDEMEMETPCSLAAETIAWETRRLQSLYLGSTMLSEDKHQSITVAYGVSGIKEHEISPEQV